MKPTIKTKRVVLLGRYLEETRKIYQTINLVKKVKSASIGRTSKSKNGTLSYYKVHLLDKPSVIQFP